MKLAEWARANGVHLRAACRWLREDRLPVPARRLESGTIGVEAAPADECGRVVHARGSSRDQRRDLGRQVAPLTAWATRNGHAAGAPMLRRVLPDPSASVVVLEHRDRLARFGVEHLEAALPGPGRMVVVTGPGESADDLARDMAGVLTWMCARLHGRRGARNRSGRAVAAWREGKGAGG